MKLLIALALLASAFASCPNLCSGHGNCGEYDSCTCWNGWMAADCSQRICPFEKAFVRTPNATTPDYHYYEECSGKGICDRMTGECQCFDGYEGKGCKRASCPNDCSGHGVCRYIEDLNDAVEYWRWDKTKIQGCVCDGGFFGADCSLRMCPKGDDPLTTTTTDEVRTFTIKGQAGSALASTGTLYFTYTDMFGNTYNTTRLALTATNDDISDALTNLPNHVFQTVTVSDRALSTNVLTFKVSFIDAHTAGPQNLAVNFEDCRSAGCYPKGIGMFQATMDEDAAVWPYICTNPDGTDCDSAFSDYTIPTGVVDLTDAAEYLSTPKDCPIHYKMIQDDIWEYRFCNAGPWLAESTLAEIVTTTWDLLPGSEVILYPVGWAYAAGSFVSKDISLYSGPPNCFYEFVGTDDNVVSWKHCGMTDYVTNFAAAAGSGIEFEDTDGYGMTFDIGGAITAVADGDYYWVYPSRIASYSFAVDALTEGKECAGRGICNRDTGLCECFEGYRDEDCSSQTTLV